MASNRSDKATQDEVESDEQEVLDGLAQYVIDQLPTEEEVEARDHESGVERGALVSLLAPPAKVRVIQTLITMQGEKANPTRICERAGIGRTSWYNVVEDLLLFGVIEQVDSAGNSPLYRVDTDDPIVKCLTEVLELGAERRALASESKDGS